MRKIIPLILATIFCSMCFADGFIERAESIKNVYLKVTEKVYVNNKKKEKSYILKIKLPDMMYKEVLQPLLNKGEIYIYKDNKKTVYLPKLKQTLEKELDDEENYSMTVIKDIKSIAGKKITNHKIFEKEKIFTFDEKDEKLNQIEYADDIRIVFEEYRDNFPVKFKVYDSKNLIADIEFTEVKLSEKFDDSEFILKK